jgi:hypothetical protein
MSRCTHETVRHCSMSWCTPLDSTSLNNVTVHTLDSAPLLNVTVHTLDSTPLLNVTVHTLDSTPLLNVTVHTLDSTPLQNVTVHTTRQHATAPNALSQNVLLHSVFQLASDLTPSGGLPYRRPPGEGLEGSCGLWGWLPAQCHSNGKHLLLLRQTRDANESAACVGDSL